MNSLKRRKRFLIFLNNEKLRETERQPRRILPRGYSQLAKAPGGGPPTGICSCLAERFPSPAKKKDQFALEIKLVSPDIKAFNITSGGGGRETVQFTYGFSGRAQRISSPRNGEYYAVLTEWQSRELRPNPHSYPDGADGGSKGWRGLRDRGETRFRARSCSRLSHGKS